MCGHPPYGGSIWVLIPSIRSISHNRDLEELTEMIVLYVLIPSIRSISHNWCTARRISGWVVVGLNPFYQVHFS